MSSFDVFLIVSAIIIQIWIQWDLKNYAFSIRDHNGGADVAHKISYTR